MSYVDAASAARSVGVVPVINLPDSAAVVPLCEALLRGGLPIAEITFRRAGAAEAIAIISERLPEVCVGAGSVLFPHEAREARAAGAQFAVAPGANPEVLAAAEEVGLPFWPGVCTPTDIERAIGQGYRLLKFFPAGALGGARTVRAMLAPYRHLGLELIPTGGIDQDSAPDYWCVPGVAAVGGTWIAPSDLIAEDGWSEITDRARATVERYRSTRSACAALRGK